jgi:hypothetical protein
MQHQTTRKKGGERERERDRDLAHAVRKTIIASRIITAHAQKQSCNDIQLHLSKRIITAQLINQSIKRS